MYYDITARISLSFHKQKLQMQKMEFPLIKTQKSADERKYERFMVIYHFHSHFFVMVMGTIHIAYPAIKISTKKICGLSRSKIKLG